MFGLLRSTKLTYEDRREVGGGVVAFAFRTDEPLRAKAGQHGILALSLAANKPFSLASSPAEDRVLIGTSLASASSFKTRLDALAPGDRVTFRGPINDFTLDGAAPHVVMLAQGVGITPMRSMLAHAALSGAPTTSTLIHVADRGHAFREDTERWAGAAHYPEHAGPFREHVAAAVRDTPEATFLVAGNPSFVSSTAGLLTQEGIPKDQVREDKYWFYTPPSRPGEVEATG